jgi:hypothetical protein
MPRIWTTRGERDALRRVAQGAEKAEQARRLAYRACFETPSGQTVLADILKRCGLVQDSFVPGSPDQTAYQAGRRRVGLEIVETINADPDAAIRLVRTGNTEELFDESF